MAREIDEDKAFEQELKGKMGWKCSCALEIIDKESFLRSVQCKNCGKTFKTNRDENSVLIVKKLIKNRRRKIHLNFINSFLFCYSFN